MAAREETVRRSELLEDSRSTLRQVEQVLGELGIRGMPGGHSRPAASLAELLGVMVRAHQEILEVVDSLQRSRGIIQKASLQRIQNTHVKLREVSTATEVAATDMLDGLDRALQMVDRLEARGDSAPGGTSDDGTADELREELFSLMSLLQFQDITSQQLAYASGVLEDVEERLVRILEIFGNDRSEAESDGPVWEAPAAADPEATSSNSAGRQAVADEIFPSP